MAYWAAELSPKYANSFGSVAWAYLRLEKSEEAIQAYKKAIEASPEDAIVGFGWSYCVRYEFSSAIVVDFATSSRIATCLYGRAASPCGVPE